MVRTGHDVFRGLAVTGSHSHEEGLHAVRYTQVLRKNYSQTLGHYFNDDWLRSLQLPMVRAGVVAERQASAGARDGVKGNRRSPAARAPLHALVRQLRQIANSKVFIIVREPGRNASLD